MASIPPERRPLNTTSQSSLADYRPVFEYAEEIEGLAKGYYDRPACPAQTAERHAQANH